MKTCILTLIFILFSTSIFSQSGWFLQNSNVNKELYEVFFVNAQTGWIVGDSNKILKTSNGGLTWFQQFLPNNNSPTKTIYFINENTGWIAGGYYHILHFGEIFKTTNGGNNWFWLTNSGEVEDIYFINASTGYVCFNASGDFVSAGGILKTTNGGLNWFNQYYGIYVINSIKFADSEVGCAVGYCWTDTGQDTIVIFKTTNGGNSWNQKYNERVYASYYYSLKDISLKNNYGWAVGKDSVILRTTNSGENWTKYLLDDGRRFNSIYFVDQNTGWAAGFRYGDTTNIIKTTNAGLSWFNLRNIYDNTLNSIFFVNENTGWAVGINYPTGNGIILKTITGGLTSINNLKSSIPFSYVLNQNYPNPFNSNTIINYQCSIFSYIQLKVHNVFGNEIATLVNEKQNAGSYYVSFDAHSLSSGIYFYQLSIDGKAIDTKQMVFLK